MKKTKQMGIWMDHSNAFLMELKDGVIFQHMVKSEFTREEKENSLDKNEIFLENKKHHFQASYYKKIADVIKTFQDVLLFGPTDAKNELLNLLKADHLFANIKIELRNTDKMNAEQMQAFIKEYFKQ